MFELYNVDYRNTLLRSPYASRLLFSFTLATAALFLTSFYDDVDMILRLLMDVSLNP